MSEVRAMRVPESMEAAVSGAGAMSATVMRLLLLMCRRV